MIIAFTPLAKTVVVSDDNSMRSKITVKKILHILLSGLAGKYMIEWHYHEVIDTGCFEQAGFFFQGGEQFDITGNGGNDLAGMRMKSDDHRFSADTPGLFL